MALEFTACLSGEETVVNIAVPGAAHILVQHDRITRGACVLNKSEYSWTQGPCNDLSASACRVCHGKFLSRDAAGAAIFSVHF